MTSLLGLRVSMSLYSKEKSLYRSLHKLLFSINGVLLLSSLSLDVFLFLFFFPTSINPFISRFWKVIMRGRSLTPVRGGRRNDLNTGDDFNTQQHNAIFYPTPPPPPPSMLNFNPYGPSTMRPPSSIPNYRLNPPPRSSSTVPTRSSSPIDRQISTRPPSRMETYDPPFQPLPAPPPHSSSPFGITSSFRRPLSPMKAQSSSIGNIPSRGYTQNAVDDASFDFILNHPPPSFAQNTAPVPTFGPQKPQLVNYTSGSDIRVPEILRHTQDNRKAIYRVAGESNPAGGSYALGGQSTCYADENLRGRSRVPKPLSSARSSSQERDFRNLRGSSPQQTQGAAQQMNPLYANQDLRGRSRAPKPLSSARPPSQGRDSSKWRGASAQRPGGNARQANLTEYEQMRQAQSLQKRNQEQEYLQQQEEQKRRRGKYATSAANMVPLMAEQLEEVRRLRQRPSPQNAKTSLPLESAAEREWLLQQAFTGTVFQPNPEVGHFINQHRDQSGSAVQPKRRSSPSGFRVLGRNYHHNRMEAAHSGKESLEGTIW